MDEKFHTLYGDGQENTTKLTSMQLNTVEPAAAANPYLIASIQVCNFYETLLSYVGLFSNAFYDIRMKVRMQLNLKWIRAIWISLELAECWNQNLDL